MIERKKYLNQLIKSQNNGFPKVITGIRRCGKSYLLQEIFKDYLVNNGVDENDILKIELDSVENFKFHDPLDLFNFIIEKTKDKKMAYVIIDEIQNVYSLINPNLTDGKHIKSSKEDTDNITFVNVVLSLSRQKNIDLYVTGSNSKMLSTDVQTEFRDKATNIKIKPLSFEEFFNYKHIDEYSAVLEYLMYGGMPLAVLKEKEEKKNYLKELFETTYLRDIIERYKFRKEEALDELCTLLATSVGETLNSEKISNIYKSKSKGTIDPETITSYINAFKDSFLLEEAFRYDLKGKNIIQSTKKYYYIDTGLRNARLNFAYSDQGHLLENAIYNELIYNDYNVNVGSYEKIEKDKNGKSIRKTLEIDFMAVKNNRKYYIQVTDDVSNEITREREIKPFSSLNDQIQKILVINKPIDEMLDDDGFLIISASDFMLRFIK